MSEGEKSLAKNNSGGGHRPGVCYILDPSGPPARLSSFDDVKDSRHPASDHWPLITGSPVRSDSISPKSKDKRRHGTGQTSGSKGRVMSGTALCSALIRNRVRGTVTFKCSEADPGSMGRNRVATVDSGSVPALRPNASLVLAETTDSKTKTEGCRCGAVRHNTPTKRPRASAWQCETHGSANIARCYSTFRRAKGT